MNFVLEIIVQNGQVLDIRFTGVTQLVGIGTALQALEAAKAALLNVPVARPEAPQPSEE